MGFVRPKLSSCTFAKGGRLGGCKRVGQPSEISKQGGIGHGCILPTLPEWSRGGAINIGGGLVCMFTLRFIDPFFVERVSFFLPQPSEETLGAGGPSPTPTIDLNVTVPFRHPLFHHHHFFWCQNNSCRNFALKTVRNVAQGSQASRPPGPLSSMSLLDAQGTSKGLPKS